jgi:hypothetical protein
MKIRHFEDGWIMTVFSVLTPVTDRNNVYILAQGGRCIVVSAVTTSRTAVS